MAEQTARNCKWGMSVAQSNVTSRGKKSAGVAVAARSHIGMSLAEPAELTQHLHRVGRFLIWRVGAICRGGRHLGCVYLTSAVGVKEKCNLDLLQYMACTIKSLTGPWCIGGDWICTPGELADTGWFRLVNGVVHAQASPTCNGKAYDFFVVASGSTHAVMSAHVIGDAGLTPHSPVRLLIKGQSRHIMVKQIKSPTPYPALLPFGPPNKMQEPDQASSSQEQIPANQS